MRKYLFIFALLSLLPLENQAIDICGREFSFLGLGKRYPRKLTTAPEFAIYEAFYKDRDENVEKLRAAWMLQAPENRVEVFNLAATLFPAYEGFDIESVVTIDQVLSPRMRAFLKEYYSPLVWKKALEVPVFVYREWEHELDRHSFRCNGVYCMLKEFKPGPAVLEQKPEGMETSDYLAQLERALNFIASAATSRKYIMISQGFLDRKLAPNQQIIWDRVAMEEVIHALDHLAGQLIDNSRELEAFGTQKYFDLESHLTQLLVVLKQGAPNFDAEELAKEFAKRLYNYWFHHQIHGERRAKILTALYFKKRGGKFEEFLEAEKIRANPGQLMSYAARFGAPDVSLVQEILWEAHDKIVLETMREIWNAKEPSTDRAGD